MGLAILIGLGLVLVGVYLGPIGYALGAVVLFIWLGNLEDRVAALESKGKPKPSDSAKDRARAQVQAKMAEYARAAERRAEETPSDRHL